jgi:hypothetical protein
MKNNFFKISILAFAMLVFSCEVTNLDTEDSPNALRADQFREDLLITSMQNALADYFESAQDFGGQLTRQLHMFGPLYDNAFAPTDVDATWQNAFAGVLVDAQALKAAATPKEGYQHLGLAKVMEAYVLMTMVDMFGDIPYAEAFKGSDNLNPGISTGADVYEQARVLLNEAISDLGKVRIAKLTLLNGAGVGPTDLFYGADNSDITAATVGPFNNWIALANTLKIRLFLNRKFTSPAAARDSIDAIAARNIINTPAEDFQFSYSRTNANPDSRHPEFGTNYDNGASDYMSNYFMNLLLIDYPTTDPRRRYYFYRQVTANTTDTNLLDCIGTTRPDHWPNDIYTPYCQLNSGYWGRDHGDDDGIPPDNARRTIWGLYPIGGRFDSGAAAAGTQNSGARGAGISPIFLSSFTNFMLAEAALSLGTTGAARTLLETAIRGSISKVMGFGTEIGYSFTAAETALVPATATVDAYVANVLARYDLATTDEERLSVATVEFYKATWGNGFEAYNMYRRTGYPANLQPTLEPGPGVFVRSLIYPANYVNRNINATQKAFPGTGVLVFWDNGSKSLD